MELEKIKMKDSPLVSIVVITYNSSKYVIETLESAKAQTYQNIELIISDDCSTDNTVEICCEWIEENKERFVRTELLTVPQNTGIPANCNRGVRAAQGEWVKLIAGDDALMEGCIKENVNFALKDPNRKIIISDIIKFRKGFDDISVDFEKQISPKHIELLKIESSPNDQYLALLKNYFGNSPSLFISKIIFDVISFDEKFPFIEDYPFALNATKKGFRFHYLDKALVYYRVSDNSVFASKNKTLLFNDFYKKKIEFDKKYRFPEISWIDKCEEKFEYYWKLSMEILNLNKNHFFCRKILNFSYYFNPFRIIKKAI